MAFFYELMAGGPAGAPGPPPGGGVGGGAPPNLTPHTGLSTDLQRFPYHVLFVFGMLAEVEEELI